MPMWKPQPLKEPVQRLRPKLMTVCAVLASLVPILWESGIGSEVIEAHRCSHRWGHDYSTIHVLILVPVFFVMMKERAFRNGTLQPVTQIDSKAPPETQPHLV